RRAGLSLRPVPPHVRARVGTARVARSSRPLLRRRPLLSRPSDARHGRAPARTLAAVCPRPSRRGGPDLGPPSARPDPVPAPRAPLAGRRARRRGGGGDLRLGTAAPDVLALAARPRDVLLPAAPARHRARALGTGGVRPPAACAARRLAGDPDGLRDRPRGAHGGRVHGGVPDRPGASAAL